MKRAIFKFVKTDRTYLTNFAPGINKKWPLITPPVRAIFSWKQLRLHWLPARSPTRMPKCSNCICPRRLFSAWISHILHRTWRSGACGWLLCSPDCAARDIIRPIYCVLNMHEFFLAVQLFTLFKCVHNTETYFLLNRYYSYPIRTSISIETLTTFDFPAVTVCNHNAMCTTRSAQPGSSSRCSNKQFECLPLVYPLCRSNNN